MGYMGSRLHPYGKSNNSAVNTNPDSGFISSKNRK